MLSDLFLSWSVLAYVSARTISHCEEMSEQLRLKFLATPGHFFLPWLRASQTSQTGGRKGDRKSAGCGSPSNDVALLNKVNSSSVDTSIYRQFNAVNSATTKLSHYAVLIPMSTLYKRSISVASTFVI